MECVLSTFVDKKFINLASVKLENFKWKSDKLANCRCPICGDSQKNRNKSRGYFYMKGNDFFYKCHNCNYGSSLYRFLEQVDTVLMGEYGIERWKNGENGRANYVKPKEENMFSSFKPKFKPTQDLLKPLTCVKDLPDNHVCKQFVTMRHIPKKFHEVLYYTKNFGAYMKLLDPEPKYTEFVGVEPRLVIPFFNKAGDVVGAQGRSLSLKDEVNARQTLRYITVKADTPLKIIATIFKVINQSIA